MTVSPSAQPQLSVYGNYLNRLLSDNMKWSQATFGGSTVIVSNPMSDAQLAQIDQVFAQKFPDSNFEKVPSAQDSKQFYIRLSKEIVCVQAKKSLFEACKSGNEKLIQSIIDTHDIDLIQAIDRSGVSLFHRACEYGLLATVKKMIALPGCPVDARSKNGRTPFISACLQKRIEIIDLLLKSGKIDPNVRDEEGQTMLQKAASQGQTLIVKMLLASPVVDVNAQDQEGKTALMMACLEHEEEVVDLLIESGKVDPNKEAIPKESLQNNVNVLLYLTIRYVDPPSHASDEYLPIHFSIIKKILQIPGIDVYYSLLFACLHERRELFDLCMQSGKVNPNCKDKEGNTVLHQIARADNPAQYAERARCISRFFEFPNIDTEIKDAEGRTAFMRACANGFTDLVDFFIEKKKIVINTKDALGNSALHLACKNGSTAIVERLLRISGILVDAKNNQGNTPFAIACMRGDEEMVDLLLKTDGIDLNTKNVNQSTPFYLACMKNDVAMVRKLIQNPLIRIDIKNDRGFSPFLTACNKGFEVIVDLLMTTGPIDINETTNLGSTALHLALPHHPEIARKLLNCPDCKIDEKSCDNRTPLMEACQGKDLAIVQQFIDSGKIANINAVDVDGETILHYACRSSSNPLIAKYLLTLVELQCDEKNKEGATPFLFALKHGLYDLADAFIEKGANLYTYESSGTSIFSIACKTSSESLLKHFRTNGVRHDDLTRQDSSMNTPLHYLLENGPLDLLTSSIRSFEELAPVKNNLRKTPLRVAIESPLWKKQPAEMQAFCAGLFQRLPRVQKRLREEGNKDFGAYLSREASLIFVENSFGCMEIAFFLSTPILVREAIKEINNIPLPQYMKQLQAKHPKFSIDEFAFQIDHLMDMEHVKKGRLAQPIPVKASESRIEDLKNFLDTLELLPAKKKELETQLTQFITKFNTKKLEGLVPVNYTVIENAICSALEFTKKHPSLPELNERKKEAFTNFLHDVAMCGPRGFLAALKFYHKVVYAADDTFEELTFGKAASLREMLFDNVMPPGEQNVHAYSQLLPTLGKKYGVPGSFDLDGFKDPFTGSHKEKIDSASVGYTFIDLYNSFQIVAMSEQELKENSDFRQKYREYWMRCAPKSPTYNALRAQVQNMIQGPSLEGIHLVTDIKRFLEEKNIVFGLENLLTSTICDALEKLEMENAKKIMGGLTNELLNVALRSKDAEKATAIKAKMGEIHASDATVSDIWAQQIDYLRGENIYLSFSAAKEELLQYLQGQGVVLDFKPELTKAVKTAIDEQEASEYFASAVIENHERGTFKRSGVIKALEQIGVLLP